MEEPSGPQAPRTLPLLRGKVTLEEALDEEENMLTRLSFPEQRLDFYVWIVTHREELQAIVSRHLGLRHGEACRLGEVKEWLQGGFNVSIPVYTENWRQHPGKRILLRLPLPFMTGEAHFPGNSEEKIRTEAAAYIWLQRHCPGVPIPFFWGFGVASRRSFIRVEVAPFLSRLRWYLQAGIAYLRNEPHPHPYVPTGRVDPDLPGYIITDFLEEEDGQMLSVSWEERRDDANLRANLFKSLARIILSLSQTPQQRIGSWTIDDRGKLSLTNRPLLPQLHLLESEGIDSGIPRTRVYDSTDSFYSDLLEGHDSRLRSQPNSICDEADGAAQMANLFVMRGLIPHFAPRDRRSGPFVVTLTDLHGPNIFVDSEWNIKYIVDLEWTSSLPLEMSTPPYWLTGRGIDQLGGQHLQAYDKVLQEYFTIFEREEKTFQPVHGPHPYCTDIARQVWREGTTFYLWALCSLKGCYNVFRYHIQQQYEPEVSGEMFSQAVFSYWARDARGILKAKMEEKSLYEQQLVRMYGSAQE